MKKFAFFNTVELNHTLSRLYAHVGDQITCSVGYSEVLENDGIEVYEAGKPLTTLNLSDALDKLSVDLGVTLLHYDVIEVGDEGDGFAFFF